MYANIKFHTRIKSFYTLISISKNSPSKFHNSTSTQYWKTGQPNNRGTTGKTHSPIKLIITAKGNIQLKSKWVVSIWSE